MKVIVALRLLGLLCLVSVGGVALAEPAGNQTITSEWFENLVENLLSGAAEGAARFGSMAGKAILRIISVTYGPLALAGAVLWASNIDRHMGKRLILGSVLLLILAEGVAPLLGI